MLTCVVTSADGKELGGKWDKRTQQFLPSAREPTVGATWTLTITVAEGNTECVNVHFLDVPAPEVEWCYTGTWERSGAPDQCTEGWGPESCSPADAHPESSTPAVHSIHGSNNTGTHGVLAIISGPHHGWTKVSFSGRTWSASASSAAARARPQARPVGPAPDQAGRRPARHLPLASGLGALVESLDAQMLMVQDAQERLTPLDDTCKRVSARGRGGRCGRPPTARAWTRGCTVEVTVAVNTTESVNAHFEDKPPALAPPSKPEQDHPEQEPEHSRAQPAAAAAAAAAHDWDRRGRRGRGARALVALDGLVGRH